MYAFAIAGIALALIGIGAPFVGLPDELGIGSFALGVLLVIVSILWVPISRARFNRRKRSQLSEAKALQEGEVLRCLRTVRIEMVQFKRVAQQAIQRRRFWPRGEGLIREAGDELKRLAEEPDLGDAHARAGDAYSEAYQVQKLMRSRSRGRGHRGRVRPSDHDDFDKLSGIINSAISALEEAIRRRGGSV